MGLLSRWRRGRTTQAVRLDPLDPTLVVLVEALDPARADSAVLAAAGIDLDRPLLVRHHLVALPDQAAVDRAAQLLAPDGYELVPAGAGAPVAVDAVRTQVLSALSLSQERSRMAGLAQRLGGDVAGWDALGHPV